MNLFTIIASAIFLGFGSAFVPLPATTASSSPNTAMGMTIDSRIDPSETAFVFIEYQNEFTTPGGKLHEAVKECMDATNMLENSQQLLWTARQMGATIIHCPISFEPGHNEIANHPYGILAGVKEGAAFTNGEWGSEICPAMQPEPGDLMVKGKSGLCGFMTTNLEFLLSQRGTKNVILGGFLTNCCVESTMRTAYEKGYRVYTLTDCVAATSLAAQNSVLEHSFGMFSVPTTSDEIVAAMSINRPASSSLTLTLSPRVA